MRRLFNLVLALLIGVISLIPFILVYILVRVTSKGPALHWSKRVGKNNKIFLMPKFRTMKIETPQIATHLMTDTQSFLTPVGSFLRKSSLDEIPQLYSILVGDMNFVGPRPALFNQDDLVEQRKQCGVDKLTPGITGWAQINGRDEITILEKVKLDEYYKDHRSILFDLKIIFRTAIKVLLKSNISH